jgi:hypothetical protein
MEPRRGVDPRQRKDYEHEFLRQVGLTPAGVRHNLVQYYRRLADLVEGGAIGD